MKNPVLSSVSECIDAITRRADRNRNVSKAGGWNSEPETRLRAMQPLERPGLTRNVFVEPPRCVVYLRPAEHLLNLILESCFRFFSPLFSVSLASQPILVSSYPQPPLQHTQSRLSTVVLHPATASALAGLPRYSRSTFLRVFFSFVRKHTIYGIKGPPISLVSCPDPLAPNNRLAKSTLLSRSISFILFHFVLASILSCIAENLYLARRRPFTIHIMFSQFIFHFFLVFLPQIFDPASVAHSWVVRSMFFFSNFS